MLAKKLAYGDTIGVVGVSNSMELEGKYEQFYKAEEFFIKKGFKVKKGKYVLENHYGSAGTIEQKREYFMDMIKDKQVKAIICLDGGETCNTFIESLDYEVIKENPKIIVGYSDITVLLQTIYKMTGLITFHGPNFVNYGEEFADENFEEFKQVFMHKQIEKLYRGNKQVVRGGNVEGKSIGTNLGSMMYLLGTPFFPGMQDKVLFIESYITSPNECKRRFTQLRQCGVFDKIKGVVIGYNYDLQKDKIEYPQMEDILLQYTKNYHFPIIKCNDFGHQIANSIIPIGVSTFINSNENKIEIVEAFLED